MKHFQRVLLAAGLLVSLSGCDAISDPSSDIPEQIVVADSTTEPSDAETAEAVTESEPSLAGTESASESTSTQTTLLSETVSTTETTTTVANADALVGDTGLTTSEWLEKAQGLYETAAKTMFQYCCTSQMFQYDFSDSNQTIIILPIMIPLQMQQSRIMKSFPERATAEILIRCCWKRTESCMDWRVTVVQTLRIREQPLLPWKVQQRIP